MALLRIGIVGCGRAARIHSERLRGLEGVRIVGVADPDPAAAAALACAIGDADGQAVSVCADHSQLLAASPGGRPDAIAIFTPHRSHYRPALDALQAGCHVFVEKPLSTNLQEAADIASLARARGLTVAVGHQFRLQPSLIAARARLAEGAIGRLRLVTATLSLPWLAAWSGQAEDSWRLDHKVSGGGLVCDAGDHLIDALLWTTGRAPLEAFAVQDRLEADGQGCGPDLVTAAAIRLDGGVPATLALCGLTPGRMFEVVYHGESGRIRTTDQTLTLQSGEGPEQPQSIDPEVPASIDADFVAALRSGRPPSCTADEALATVRLLEALGRSAATGQPVRLTAPPPPTS
jgi:predicted dehydrogenase